jgi:hypothetical protein
VVLSSSPDNEETHAKKNRENKRKLIADFAERYYGSEKLGNLPDPSAL